MLTQNGVYFQMESMIGTQKYTTAASMSLFNKLFSVQYMSHFDEVSLWGKVKITKIPIIVYTIKFQHQYNIN